MSVTRTERRPARVIAGPAQWIRSLGRWYVLDKATFDRALARAGFTQRALAEAMETSYANMSRWRNGRGRLRGDQAIRLAGLLNVSFKKLVRAR